MRDKMTLKEALSAFKIDYKLIEDTCSIPKGSIAQYAHGSRSPSMQRLKHIEKGLRSIGEDLMNVRLINETK